MTDKAQHPNPQVTPADSMDKNVFFKTILTTYSNDNVRCFMVDGFGDLGDADNFERYEKAVKSAIKRLGYLTRLAASKQ